MKSDSAAKTNSAVLLLLKEERATSVMELVLTFPIVVFIMLFLIGMGHTLITKQQALVAARFTAQYSVVNGSAPTPAKLAQAASGGQGRWRASVNAEDSDGGAAGGIGGGGILGSVLGFFNSFVGALTGDNRQVVRVSTTPERGIMPRLFRLGDATAVYVVEHNTWTCEGGRGSYLSIVTTEINNLAGSVPLLGMVTGLINRAIGGIPCCETYESPGAGRQ